MSTFKVPITKILELKEHPFADNLLVAKVYNYEVIIPKNTYNVGDTVIYVPVDTVFSGWLEELIFPEDSKIKLNKSRVRAIKIRGVVSYGMLLDPLIEKIYDTLLKNKVSLDDMDRDVAEYLGLVKYQPPVSEIPKLMRVSPSSNPYKVKDFKEYTDIEHGKYYDRMVMITGEPVVVTQKLHGTSARYGWFKREPITFLDKVRNAIGLLPKWQFCWGSRRCQIQAKPNKKHDGFKSDTQGVDFGDVYTKIKDQLDLPNRIPKGFAIYGEIVGWGIQKGYLYNCGLNQHEFYVYDVMKDGKYLNPEDMLMFCKLYGFKHVPVLYRGPYMLSEINKLLKINLISKEINEGVVVKPEVDRIGHPHMGRVVLKYINEDYLLRDNTEFN